MIKDKKAKMTTEHWVEYAALAILLVGLVISLLSDAAIVSYVVIFLCGVFVGRISYLRRTEIGFPFYLIVVFFVLGYVIGVSIRDRGVIFVCFIMFGLGIFAGRYLHIKRYFK